MITDTAQLMRDSFNYIVAYKVYRFNDKKAICVKYFFLFHLDIVLYYDMIYMLRLQESK